jgi:hypothetical protein
MSLARKDFVKCSTARLERYLANIVEILKYRLENSDDKKTKVKKKIKKTGW